MSYFLHSSAPLRRVPPSALPYTASSVRRLEPLRILGLLHGAVALTGYLNGVPRLSSGLPL
jgi:hypothetical protein